MLITIWPWARDSEGIISLDGPLRRGSNAYGDEAMHTVMKQIKRFIDHRRSHLGRHAAHLIVSAAQAHCQRLFADISDERARLQAHQMDQDEDSQQQCASAL